MEDYVKGQRTGKLCAYRLPQALVARLKTVSHDRLQTQTVLVRLALEAYLPIVKKGKA